MTLDADPDAARRCSRDEASGLSESAAFTQAQPPGGPRVGPRGLLLRLDEVAKQQPVAYGRVGDDGVATRQRRGLLLWTRSLAQGC
jgi:hypothetical protein